MNEIVPTNTVSTVINLHGWFQYYCDTFGIVTISLLCIVFLSPIPNAYVQVHIHTYVHIYIRIW